MDTTLYIYCYYVWPGPHPEDDTRMSIPELIPITHVPDIHRPGKVDSLFLISHFLNLTAGGRSFIIITSSKFLEVTTEKAMNNYFLRVKQHGTALHFSMIKKLSKWKSRRLLLPQAGGWWETRKSTLPAWPYTWEIYEQTPLNSISLCTRLVGTWENTTKQHVYMTGYTRIMSTKQEPWTIAKATLDLRIIMCDL